MPSNNWSRSLKASLYSTYLDFRTTYYIMVGIFTGVILTQLALVAFAPFGTTSSNSSALNSGLMISFWALPISLMAITSNSELLKKFSFPVDRNILALCHLLYILITPLAMLLTSCAFYLAERMIFSFMQTFVPDFIYYWITTRGSFITGFFMAYCAIVLIGALTYFIFMYFYRYKLATSISFGVFLILCFTSAPFQGFLLEILNALFSQISPFELCAVCMGLSLVFFALGYIPLKRMEVKK